MSQSLQFPAQPDAPEPTTHRRVEIEPGTCGQLRLVYKDEEGYPLVDWRIPVTASEDARRIAMKAAQFVGDSLPSATVRAAPRLFPRLLP